MSKKFQLSIPTPCNENWDNMTPVEKGRFCGSCQKQVVDFSKMSDREVAMFFKKPSTGSVCGRFMEEQLNRDIEIPKKRIPWIKYFFQFALPAFLISARASAQGKVKVKNNSIQSEQVSCSRTLGKIVPTTIERRQTVGDTVIQPIKEDTAKSIAVTGKVQDETGSPIAFATVLITETTKRVMTNEKGEFAIQVDNLAENTYLTVSALGFRSVKIVISKDMYSNANVIMVKDHPWLSGEVLVAGVLIRTPVKKRIEIKALPIISKLMKDTIIKYFKVFPNPIQSGASLNIEWKQPEEGEYMLQLFNQSGQLIFNKAMWIDKDARVLNLEIPNVAAGNYFLRMTNKPSGKSYSEKIIIE